MIPSNFDELTKALATAPSRRHALRVIVTASVGGLLGLTSIGTAFGRARLNKPAPPRGNSGCVDWCAQVFGPNTSAAGQCASQAARGSGLCAQCGSSTLPQNICCVRNTKGYCSGSAPASCACDLAHCCNGGCHPCCNSNQCTNGNTCGANHTCVCGSGAACTGSNTCINGSCCPNNKVCGNTCCSTGQTCLSNGTCATSCPNTLLDCPQGCSCFGSSDPPLLCGDVNSGQGSCTSTDDCPTGQFCNIINSTCYTACGPCKAAGAACSSDGECCGQQGGALCCNGICTNAFCGSCGNVCPSDNICAGGVCIGG